MTPLLTVAQVAAFYGVTQRTVLRWAAAGKLPAYRLHDAVRFRREELPQEPPARRSSR